MIKIMCILIVFGLCLAIFINGRDLSCDRCAIKFTSFTGGYEGQDEKPMYQEFYVNITELYDSYSKDECILKFDKNGGFLYGNKVVIG